MIPAANKEHIPPAGRPLPIKKPGCLLQGNPAVYSDPWLSVPPFGRFGFILYQ